MSKMITPAMLGYGAHFSFREFFVLLPAHWTLQEFLEPDAWGHLVSNKLISVNDLVRIRAHDGRFDSEFRVSEVLVGAAFLEPWPKLPTDIGDLQKPRGMVCVPFDMAGRPKVRTEEIPNIASTEIRRFRVIALNGQELSRHASKREADAALDYYLEQLSMRLPTPEEIEIAERAAATARIERRNAGDRNAG